MLADSYLPFNPSIEVKKLSIKAYEHFEVKHIPLSSKSAVDRMVYAIAVENLIQYQELLSNSNFEAERHLEKVKLALDPPYYLDEHIFILAFEMRCHFMHLETENPHEFLRATLDLRKKIKKCMEQISAAYKELVTRFKAFASYQKSLNPYSLLFLLDSGLIPINLSKQDSLSLLEEHESFQLYLNNLEQEKKKDFDELLNYLTQLIDLKHRKDKEYEQYTITAGQKELL